MIYDQTRPKGVRVSYTVYKYGPYEIITEPVGGWEREHVVTGRWQAISQRDYEYRDDTRLPKTLDRVESYGEKNVVLEAVKQIDALLEGLE